MSDELKLSSGNTINANRGFIGINQELELSEGYDGGINWPPEDWYEIQLTKEDMLELANIMIERWNAFKHQVRNQEI